MVCDTCKESKANQEFPWRNTHAGVRSPTCRQCKSATNKRWYANLSPEKKLRTRQKAIDNYRERKAFVDNAKARPCTDCGGTFPACAMDFDHRDSTVKVASVSRLLGQGRPLSVLQAEIDKCDAVCANCHRIRHYG